MPLFESRRLKTHGPLTVSEPTIDLMSNFSELEAAEEARDELEWALEELYLRVRDGDLGDLPGDVSSLVPWLKCTTRRSTARLRWIDASSTKKR